jgi:OHCU decarboxylase
MNAGINHLNTLSQADAETALLSCCASKRWAAAMSMRRPYPTPQSLFDRAEEVWWTLDESDWEEAFAAHPRIGDRNVADQTARREQSGVAEARPEVLSALADGNHRYEERFDRVFLICASGRSAAEMLTVLKQRLANDDAIELRAAAAEQAKITRLRLECLVT